MLLFQKCCSELAAGFFVVEGMQWNIGHMLDKDRKLF